MNHQRANQNGSQRKKPALSPLGLVGAHGGRRRLTPFFFRIGPVALSICSVLLMSLMAILYLSQLGQAVTTNQQIQDLRSQQAVLQRQNNDLTNTIGQEQSPAYIAARARKMGLVPADPRNVQVIVIAHMQGSGDQP
jgi:cell division protein FtsB